MTSPESPTPRRVADAARSPLAWVLVGLAGLFATGLGWGLPGSDSWDNDGAAPRDFLVSVAQTFAKQGFDVAYLHLAPLHCALLAVATLPVTIAALASAPSTAPDAVVQTLIQTRYMTANAWIARSVCVAMALGTVYALAKIGEELQGRRAGAIVAATCGLNAGFVYYAHTSNLEVPYLFWGSFALLALVRAITRSEPRRLRAFAVLGALAIGSKDQAAGLFLLGAPTTLLYWRATAPWARTHRRLLAREATLALAIALGVFLVADEVVLNPAGFAARVRYVLGPACSDHAEYVPSTAGRLALLWDMGKNTSTSFPRIFVPLGALGLGWALGTTKEKRPAVLAPLFVALSFTICINATALRSEQRFIQPQLEVLGLYAGLALDTLLGAPFRGALLWLVRATSGVALAQALRLAASVDATLLLDPRYDAEAWLRSHVATGETIETYGLNVYLPRFPVGTRVERVGIEPIKGRSPLPGVEERVDEFANLPARRPEWIAVSRAWVSYFLEDPPYDATPGRRVPPAQFAAVGPKSRAYFRALLAGENGYRMAHTSAWSSKVWPAAHIHASTGETVWILERVN